MEIRSRLHINGIYRLLNAVALACIGVFALGKILGLTDVSRLNILVLFVTLLAMTSVNFFPWKGKLLCLLSAVALWGVSAAVVGLETEAAFLGTYLRWCMGYPAERSGWAVGCQLVQTAAIAAAAFLLEILLEKIRFLKVFLALLCMTALAVCLFTHKTIPHMGVVFVIFYVVEVYLERFLGRWNRVHGGSVQDRGTKAQIVWLSPFLIAFLFMTSVMPAPEEPLRWDGVKNVYQQLREMVQSVSWGLFPGGNDTFDFSLSGFSEEGKLGGGVRKSDREVMKLRWEKAYVPGIYLTGNILDTFDGRQWTKTDHGKEEERFLDTLETLNAVEALDGTHREDYLLEVGLQLKYQYFRSEYVFAPLKAFEIRDDASELEFSFDGGDMLSGKRLGRGNSFHIRYYQLNIGEDLFDELADRLLEEGQLQTAQISEELAAHRQGIYENYLDEVTLSQAAAEYLARITEGKSTIMERLRAIESELRSFTYTGSPGSLQKTVTDAGTFLDYFLLESRKGYCTYFATAFVLLARAQGIPARYVQGFCVPVERNGETVVLSGMAHSWPEVYIAGLGWIPFEPTPGYESFRYAPWKVSGREGLSTQENREEDGNTGEMDEEGLPDEKDGEEESGNEEEDAKEAEAIVRRRNLERAFKMLIWGISALLAVGILVLAGEILYVRYLYGKMSLEEKLNVEARRNLRILTWLGVRQREDETLQELKERASRMQDMPPLRFIEIYEMVLYGGKAVSGKLLEETKQERTVLYVLLKRKKKIFFIFYRVAENTLI